MSTQRGNLKKRGPPKHQNKSAFKNTLHDTNAKTKQIVELQVSGVCERCKEVIDWKIKYKKYKPLTQPKKCVKCLEKTVKRAYYIVCQPCASRLDVCAKCGENRDVVSKYGLDPSEESRQQSELNFELRNLPERKRRSFFRMQEKGDIDLDEDSDDAGSDEDTGATGGKADALTDIQDCDSACSSADTHQIPSETANCSIVND